MIDLLPAGVGREAPDGVVESVATVAAEVFGLTPRERECVCCLLEGKSNRETSQSLGCGEKTVETHVTHILGKARMRTRLQLVAFAWGRWARRHAPR